MSHSCPICRGPYNKEPKNDRNSSSEQVAEATSSNTSSDDEEAAGGSSSTTSGSGSSSGPSIEEPNMKKAKPSNTEQTAQLVSPRCGHIFHRSCLMALLASGSKYCPVCKVICNKNLIKPVFLSMSETSSSSSIPEEPKKSEDSSSSPDGPAKTGADADKKDDDKDANQQGLSDEDKLQLQTQANEDLQEQIEQARVEKRLLQNRFDKLHAEFDADNMSIITYIETISKLKRETQELSDKLANKIKEVSKDADECKLLESSIKVMEEENKKLQEDNKKMDKEVERIIEMANEFKDSLQDMDDILAEVRDVNNVSGNVGDFDEDEDESSDDDGNESGDEDQDESDDEDQDESSDEYVDDDDLYE